MSFFQRDWLDTVSPLIKFKDPSINNSQSLRDYIKAHEGQYPDNNIIGTATFIKHENHTLIVTNKHVIDEGVGYGLGFTLRSPQADHKPVFLFFSHFLDRLNLQWLYDEPNDIAISKLIVSKDREYDFKYISTNLFCERSSLIEGWDIFYVGYPVSQASRNMFPILRQGMISAFDLPSEHEIIIDAYAAPGNSGGPCFLKPSLVSAEGPNSPPYRKKPFIGIISQTMQRTLYSSTGYHSNTLMAGLSFVISGDAILNILNTAAYQNYIRSAENNLLNFKSGSES